MVGNLGTEARELGKLIGSSKTCHAHMTEKKMSLSFITVQSLRVERKKALCSGRFLFRKMIPPFRLVSEHVQNSKSTDCIEAKDYALQWEKSWSICLENNVRAAVPPFSPHSESTKNKHESL